MTASNIAPPSSEGTRQRLLRWLLLLGAPILLYAGTLHYPLTGIDDTLYYAVNPVLGQGWHAFLEVWRQPFFDDYAPITQLTILADLRCSPHALEVARLQQLLWLGIGGLACERLLWRVTGQPRLALLLACAYVVHPVCSESAMWLAERKNVVAIALSWWSVERHLAWRQGGRWPALVASLVLCALALLAKTHAVVIPALIAAWELILARDDGRRRLLAVVPTGVLTAAFLGICLWGIHLYPAAQDMRLGGSLAASVWCDGAILWRYLGHVVLPRHLSLFYGVIEDPTRWRPLLAGWGGVLAVLAVSIGVARERRPVVWAWCAAGCSLLPVLNLKPLPLPMCDHYLQWALPWILLALALPVRRLLSRGAPAPAAPDPAGPAGRVGPRRPDASGVVAVGFVVYLALLAAARVPSFRSALELTATDARQEPTAVNWGVYCSALADQGQLFAAGCAGMRALACSDAHRMFDKSRIVVLSSAALACRQLQGQAASDALLAQHLHLVDPKVARLVQGVVLLQEQRPVEARARLASVFTPDLAQAAHAIDDACRVQGCPPWQLPAVSFAALSADQFRQATAMAYLLQSLTALAQADLDTGRPEEALVVLELVVNADRHYLPALQLYRSACARLQRDAALQAVDRELAAQAPAALPPATATP